MSVSHSTFDDTDSGTDTDTDTKTDFLARKSHVSDVRFIRRVGRVGVGVRFRVGVGVGVVECQL